MRACKNCGHTIDTLTKYCPECGAATGVSKDSANEVSVGLRKTLGIPPKDVVARARQRDGSFGDAVTLSLAGGGSESDASVRGAPLAGRYELIDEIGRGGFARVWKARDKKLGRIVAIKRLLPDTQVGGGNEQALIRFQREAQAIAQLNHRNIVAVFDHDRDAEGDYIVMEYIDGGTLREHLKARGGVLPVQEAVELVRGVVQGLDHAHRKNLIHRDIKPANILLQEAPEDIKGQGLDWIPKIVDFGLARAGSESGVSLSGYGMGTPAYMPPEQRRDAKNVNHTADFYAVGKTLYEMVSGMPPDDVDPEKIPPAVGLSEVIFKCIKSNAGERYFSADELLAALNKVGGARAASKNGGSAATPNACPACGVANPDGVKFCEGCGGGLTRVCPECGRENSVNKQFCGGCGTDVTGFLTAQDVLSRIRKYAEERRWSRVQKESKSLNPDVRLNGAKGKELLRTLVSLNDEAARMLGERDRLDAAIGKVVAQDGGAEEALKLIACYQDIDPHKDWTEEIAKLEKCAREHDFAEAQRAAEKAARHKNYVGAAGAWKAYVAKHPQGGNIEQARANISCFESSMREAEDDGAFEAAKREFAGLLEIGDFRAAEKVCESYIAKFSRHVKEAESLRKQAVDHDEERRRQQQVRLERQLRRLRVSVVFGVIVVLSLLAIRSSVALWRIYVFESAVDRKDLPACQQTSKRLIWFYSPEKAQAKMDAVGTFQQKKAAFLSLRGDKEQLLKEHGGPDWPAVQKMVARADDPGDPMAGSKAYIQGTERLRRILEQVQAYQDARDTFTKTVGGREQDLLRFGGAQWAAIQHSSGQAAAQNDPCVGALAFESCTQQAKEILGRIEALAEARQAYRMQVGTNEKVLSKYGGGDWAAVEKTVEQAEGATDPARGAALFARASDLVRPIIVACDRVLTAQNKWEKARGAFNEAEFAEYAPQLWRQAGDLQKSVESEKDALKAASLYEEMIGELEKAAAEIKNRKEAETAMLGARDTYRRSAAQVDERLVQKHVPEEWQRIQQQVAKADKDCRDVSKFEVAQTAYESAASSVEKLNKRLDAMNVAKRQFEKKQALFEADFGDVERMAPAEWKQFLETRILARNAQDPEEICCMFKLAAEQLEKAVRTADSTYNSTSTREKGL